MPGKGEAGHNSPYMARSQDWLILPDVHFPFTDQALWKAALRVAHDLGPKLYGVVITGDFLDLYTISRHNRQSLFNLRGLTLSDEYRAGREAIVDLSAVLARRCKGEGRRHYLYGNHEDRYFRFLKDGDNGKLGAELRDPADALRLREHGYTVHTRYAEDRVELGSKLLVTHGEWHNLHAAKTHLEAYPAGKSVIFGHTHRFSTYGDSEAMAWNIGFMGDKRSPGFLYMPRAKRERWVNAFAVVRIDAKGDHFVEPIILSPNRTFNFRGKVYQCG